MGIDIKLNDFWPVNRWKVDRSGVKFISNDTINIYYGEKDYQHIVDETTGRLYLNENTCMTIFKGVLLIPGTAIAHTIAMIVNMVCLFFKIISFYPLWKKDPDEEVYDFSHRIKQYGICCLRFVCNPVSLVCLQLCTFFILFKPLDGKKIYASIERAQYDVFRLAPCFQPNPEYHFLNGDISLRDEF